MMEVVYRLKSRKIALSFLFLCGGVVPQVTICLPRSQGTEATSLLKTVVKGAAKGAYNASKLYMVKILCFHSLVRNYDIIKQNPRGIGAGVFSQDGLQTAIFALSAYALLESVYNDYVNKCKDVVQEKKCGE